MTRRFNHLHVPDQWEQYWTKYPQGYTMMEAIINWVGQVDAMVDDLNNTHKHLEDFNNKFITNLKRTTSDYLNEMLSTGAFQDIFLSLPKNVQSYGAAGDGVTLDDFAFQKTLHEGGRVFIPQGKYRLGQRLVVGPDTHIIAHPLAEIWLDGDDYCILQNGDLLDCFHEYDGYGNITIEGGIWDCGGNPGVNSLRGGFFLGHAKHITIRDLTVKNVYETHHIEINSSKHVTIDNCVFIDFYGNRAFSEAIQIDLAKDVSNFPPFGNWDNTVVNGIVINDCYFKNVGAGVGTHVTSSQIWHENVTVTNCLFEDIRSHAVHFQNMKQFLLSNNKLKNGQTGILLEGCYEGAIENNYIKDCSGNGIQLSNSSHTKIKGNTMSRCANGFTGYDGSKNLTIEDNRIAGNTANGVNLTGGGESLIRNNSIEDNGGIGIYLHTSAKNNFVEKNRITGNGSSGINIQSMADNNKVHDNIVEGNGTKGTTSNINLLTGASNTELKNNYIRKKGQPSLYNIAVGADVGAGTRLIDNDDEGITAIAGSVYMIQDVRKKLDLKNGWTNYSEEYPLSYTMKGNEVLLSGIVAIGTLGGTDSDNLMVAQLPGIARPKQANFAIASGIGGGMEDFARINILPSGRIVVPVVNGLTHIDFSNVKLIIK